MRNAAATVEDFRRVASAQGVILFDPAVLPQATPELHDPRAWRHSEVLGGRGGRGGAVLVQDEFGTGLLRHYRRGGLVGHWVRESYLFLGEERTRCVRELRLLAHLYRRGLPVPRPVFATWRRHGLFYRADLMTLLIPDACTVAERLRAAPGQVPWEKIGMMIARFHRAGAFHADLNAHNILLDGAGKVWLIDFDRGRLRPPAVAWQQANLQRLKRSLDKLGGISAEDWRRVQDAHAHTLVEGDST